MFRRREDGTEEFIADGADGVSPAPANAVPAMPNAGAGTAQPSFRPAPPQAAVAAARPATPTITPTPATPAAEAPRPATPVATPAATASRLASSKRVLTVGPDIQMKGEITSCDRVVIEGLVDATMRDVHTVELTETGSLKGTAEVEDAEISGAFEGDLVVRGKLTVHQSGRVRGNITYGEIEIQRGGQISGNVRNVAEAKANGGMAHKAKAA